MFLSKNPNNIIRIKRITISSQFCMITVGNKQASNQAEVAVGWPPLPKNR